MPLHGGAEAEEVHKDHVWWWFQINSSKKGSKILTGQQYYVDVVLRRSRCR
jgi:hypothetical protein